MSWNSRREQQQHTHTEGAHTGIPSRRMITIIMIGGVEKKVYPTKYRYSLVASAARCSWWRPFRFDNLCQVRCQSWHPLATALCVPKTIPNHHSVHVCTLPLVTPCPDTKPDVRHPGRLIDSSVGRWVGRCPRGAGLPVRGPSDTVTSWQSNTSYPVPFPVSSSAGFFRSNYAPR